MPQSLIVLIFYSYQNGGHFNMLVFMMVQLAVSLTDPHINKYDNLRHLPYLVCMISLGHLNVLAPNYQLDDRMKTD